MPDITDTWIVHAERADELHDRVMIPGIGDTTVPRSIVHDRGIYTKVVDGKAYEIKPFYAPWPAYTIKPMGKEQASF